MPSRNIADCEPLLQEFWPKLQTWYEALFPGRELFLTCTCRSAEEQQEIFKKNTPGQILTRCDGIKNLSKHNYKPAKALDFAVKVAGVVQWRESYYLDIGTAIEDLGYEGKVRWGGYFSFKDYPHLEVKETV